MIEPRLRSIKSSFLLEDALEVLLNQGLPDSWLRLEIPFRPEFLQFGKRVEYGQISIHLMFPLADWSKDYYPKVQEILKHRGHRYVIETVPEGHSLKEWLTLELGEDIQELANIARLVLEEVFGRSIRKRLRVKTDRVLRK